MNKVTQFNYHNIEKIFNNFLDDIDQIKYDNKSISQLIYCCISQNKIIWDLEDDARYMNYGSENIAEIKKRIDEHNQTRNNLIREIDEYIHKELMVVHLNSLDNFYSESPGMIIDRLSIMFLKRNNIISLINIIKEIDLLDNYKKKESIISNQISVIGKFYDFYINKLSDKSAYFIIQEPVKIYNDSRIRKYIDDKR